MATRPIVAFLLLATLAFAMVAESSLSSSNFNDPAVSILSHSSDGGLDELTAGRIGDTLFEDEEMMMPTESARRALNDRDHISYRAMSKNAIPCNRRGASYYQCTRMQRVRPYTRGCTRIARCQRRA